MSSMNLQIAVVLLAVVVPLASATTYTVGDSGGWETGVNYVNWVSGKTFVVGDILSFTYTNQHSVVEVSKSDYSSCSTSNPIATNSASPTSVTLNKTGELFFVCGTPGHCSQGMKLDLNVSAAGTTASPPPPGATTASPPPPGSTTSSPPPPRNAAGDLHVRRMDVVMAFAFCLVAVLLWQ
ncbi:hypothetical protein SUGI_0988240 [Cryptomeria japonica]|uniref:mavicyanin n=1 Tax=Cryptomeria japonica TaxID=3369 RepID=UPI002414B312|nr:mavicyanin [Cryptomeria japonica]GLJ46847.1 hypothetical protein SUGI_0988240 [Cryptomeria japonica]